MQRPPLPYSRQKIEKDDIEVVCRTLERDVITQGPELQTFEEELASKCGARYAICFNSGTAALWAAVASLGLEKGVDGVVPAITFVASATALIQAGVRPIIADVNPATGNLDADTLRASITEKTSVIVVVHYGGLPAPMEEIARVAASYGGIPIIEDAAHALGASYKGEPVGSCSLSKATVFSFHPVKAITTGEGGALVTNDSGLAEKARRYRHHGITPVPERGPWYYDVTSLGMNGRITEFQCALGRSQLKKLDSYIVERNAIASTYDDRLAATDGISSAAKAPEGSLHAYHLYPARLDDPSDRGALFETLISAGIRPQVHYIPLHYHSLFRSLGAPEKGSLKGAENFYETEISLPIYPGLTREDQERVLNAIAGFFAAKRLT
ncbi:MAG: UDP-4-amino-4,6-dideoxy-N-acetyl-beta-L-altrosamine transaminase [Acidimicrobiia bacterium]